MASYVSRAAIAEHHLRQIGDAAQKHVSQIIAHSVILEAAMAVIVKRGLLDDLVAEHARLTAQPIEPPTPKPAGGA